MSKLDQLVKGAAPPGTSVPLGTPRSPSPPISSDATDILTSNPSTPDPTANLPSSPPQIYLNLLILEASLRSQYLTLRARRRQNTFFLLLLALWNAFFFYALFLQPREDGSGIGGSVYWMVEMTEKVALMGGVVTGILVWGTGQWERGVRWPRRFVGVTNRGLRTMNCKIIVLKGPWWKEMLGHLSFLFPVSSFNPSPGSAYHYIETPAERRSQHTSRHGYEDEHDLVREEDLAPGGDFIKLLLLPKPFSPDFRENWELYRTEYWEKENERRAMLLQQWKRQERQRAKQEGGWFWWLGWQTPKRRSTPLRDADIEKPPARHHSERDSKRLSNRRGESHSRNTSRSSTPAGLESDERPPSRGSRQSRGSFSSSDRRKLRSSNSISGQPISKLTPSHPRPSISSLTGNQSPLTRAGSNLGTSSGNESG